MDTEREQEFRAFVAARSRALTATAYLLCGDADQAGDLVQSALATAWVRWSRIKDRGRAEAYVRKTIYHAYIDRTRLFSWRRERSAAEVPEPRTAEAEADLADTVARSHDLAALVRRLPRGQRAVIVLSYYEDKSDAEAADVLGVSVSTVRTQRFKALRALRVLVQEDERLADGAGREVIA